MKLDCRAKFACSAASLLSPYPGGPRQPLDRQLRYYSVTACVASGLYRVWNRSLVTGGNEKDRLTQETPPSSEAAFQCLRWACYGHWPPSQMESGRCLRRSYCRLPGRLLPFEGRSLAVALAGYPVLLGLAGCSSSGRYITGAYSLAIGVPFGYIIYFQMIMMTLNLNCLDSGSRKAKILPKNVGVAIGSLQFQINAGTGDNSAFRGQPAMMRRIGVWQRRQGSPVRW